MTYTRLLRRLDPSVRRQSQGDRGNRRRRLRQGGWQVRRAAGARDADGVLTVTKELAPGERARLRLQTAG